MSSLFEQWRVGRSALTFESWLVKHIKELEAKVSIDGITCDPEQPVTMTYTQYAGIRNHIKALEAKVARLSARGIEDMQCAIKELEADKEAEYTAFCESREELQAQRDAVLALPRFAIYPPDHTYKHIRTHVSRSGEWLRAFHVIKALGERE